MAKRSKKRCKELSIWHPHAAGIDVGASELFVERTTWGAPRIHGELRMLGFDLLVGIPAAC